MLEIFLIIIVSYKRIFPLAKAQGRNGFGWVGLTILVWLTVEIIVYVVFVVFAVFVDLILEKDLLASFYFYLLVYVTAVICGAMSANYICSFLEKDKTSHPNPPLPPKDFSEILFADSPSEKNN